MSVLRVIGQYMITVLVVLASTKMCQAQMIHELSFGAQGTGEGEFTEPFATAFDDSGNIYVSDSENYRIQVWSPAGTFLRNVGGDFGSNQVFGIGVASTGTVYALIRDTHTVRVYQPGGLFSFEFGGYGAGPGQFDTPFGLAIDAQDNVYVADSDNHRVQVFDSTGAFIREFGAFGSGVGQLNRPRNLTVDEVGNVYVAEQQNHRIQVFDPAGQSLLVAGEYGSGEGQLSYPSGVAVDSTGRIYVADGGNNRVLAFKSTGQYDFTYGELGSAQNQFDRPNGVSVDANDRLLVADTFNYRISRFQLDIDYGLIAHYPLDGNAEDESIYQNDGRVDGATFTEDRFGNVLSAARFDGVDDYIEILNNAQIDFDANEDFSLSAWFVYLPKQYPRTVAPLLIKREDPCTGYTIYVDATSGEFLAGGEGSTTGGMKTCHGDGSGLTSEGLDLRDSGWHHFVVSREFGSEWKLFIDGELVKSAPDTFAYGDISGSFSNGESLVIGAYDSVFNPQQVTFFKGKVDELRVYDRVLNSSEVRTLAGRGEEITVYLPGDVPLELVYIPEGTFEMGSPTGERSRGAVHGSEDLHQVTLSEGYYLGKYEITQAQWQALMGSNPSSGHGVGPNHPVYYISWESIAGPDGFVERLNNHLDATGQPGAGHFRLPTDAEWERAARAGTQTRFSYGDVLECDDVCGMCATHDQYMVWCGNDNGGTTTVGSRIENQFGLFDMHGNVFEYVQDWYSSLGHDSQVDPVGPESGTRKVFRGGSWYNRAQYCRSAYRSDAAPDWSNSPDIGFRIARNAHAPDCSSGIVTVAVDLPIPDASIDIRYGAQNLVSGDTFVADDGTSIQWRLTATGYNSPWLTYQVQCADPVLRATEAEYQIVTIENPVQGALVDLRYGPQNLSHGDQVILPRGITVQWRIEVSGYNGSWRPFAVDSGPVLAVTESDYCLLTISTIVPSATVDLRYGPQDLMNGEQVPVPRGLTLQWRVSVGGFDSAWKQYLADGDCQLVAGEADVALLAIDNPASGGLVDIRYGAQNLAHGAVIEVPFGITLQWRLEITGFNGPWNTFLVDSSVLSVSSDAWCDLLIEAPVAAEVDVRYGPQNLVNGDTVALPTGITVQWRITDDCGTSGWSTFDVEAGSCVLSLIPETWVGVAWSNDAGVKSHHGVTIDFVQGLAWDACSKPGVVLSGGVDPLIVDFPNCGELTLTCTEENSTYVCTGSLIAHDDGRMINRKYWLARTPTH